MKGVNATLSQYADDTTLFLDGIEQPFTQCIFTLEEFPKYFGLKMNRDKTKAVCVGYPRPPEPVFLREYNLEWNPTIFTILGINFIKNILKNITENSIET
ncbi:Pol-like protein [Elysia marginata]|uniref:Pol-like protein n=1 Tax=Elysia marginata TaxID=1093978 RepID=A0AAV4GH62_9GAST|nr:Pol-like protein [Elysia marginata]